MNFFRFTLFYCHYYKVLLFVLVAFGMGFTICYSRYAESFSTVLLNTNVFGTQSMTVFGTQSSITTNPEIPVDETETAVKKIIKEWLVPPSYQSKLNRSSLGLQNMAIVTFTSSNHLAEALFSCISLSLVPELKDVPYYVFFGNDIDIAATELFQQTCSKASIKFFHREFRGFPSYIFEYQSYRFKSIIPALILKQYPILMWADASIRFEPKNPDDFKNLIKRALEKSDVVDIELYRTTGHMMYPAIHNKTYEFFPDLDPEKLKSVEQNQALFLLYFGTSNGWKHYSRLFRCALEKECMAPSGAVASGENCSIASMFDHPKAFSGCHRFDQSVLNIVCYIASGGNRTLYTMKTDAIHVIGYPKIH